jgi:hypothetical protein
MLVGVFVGIAIFLVIASLLIPILSSIGIAIGNKVTDRMNKR